MFQQQQHFRSSTADVSGANSSQDAAKALLCPGEVLASSEQSAAADFGQLKLLDVHAVAEKFRSDTQPGRLSYVHHLAGQAPLSKFALPDQGSRLPPNVQPSVLQHKLCAGANRLSSCLLPTPTADGLAYNDLPAVTIRSSYGGDSNPQQRQRPTPPAVSSSSGSTHVWQFSFSLHKAMHVGPTGFEPQRQPLYQVARVCIFDRRNNRFIGNVHTLPVSSVRHKGSTWLWDPAGHGRILATGMPKPRADLIPPGQLVGSPAAATAAAVDRGRLLGAVMDPGTASLGSGLAGAGGANAFVVRCAQEVADPVCGLKAADAERLSLYIELNVAFKLTVEDSAVVPQAEAKGSGLVSELSTCWSLVSLGRCAELSREMDISVPLYTGSIYQPGLLAAVWAAERKLHPLRSMFTAAPTPQLTFSAGPLPAQPAPLLPYNLMPSSMIARRDVAYLLAAARLALAQQLAAAAAAARQGLAGSLCQLSSQPTHALLPAGPAGTTAVADAVGCSPGVVCSFGDAALAALPQLLDDSLLLDELTARWWGRCRGLAAADDTGDCLLSCTCNTVSSMPSQHQLVAALTASVLEVAPLLHCSNMPEPHMTNFAEHQQHRARVAAGFLRMPDPSSAGAGANTSGQQQQQPNSGPGRHPVEPLSRLGAEFLHAPFDVAETRVCLADLQAAAKWSRC